MAMTQITTFYELLTGKQSPLDAGYRASCWACNDEQFLEREDAFGDKFYEACDVCKPVPAQEAVAI